MKIMLVFAMINNYNYHNEDVHYTLHSFVRNQNVLRKRDTGNSMYRNSMKVCIKILEQN